MTTCAGPGCDRQVHRSTRGRPAAFCSDTCRKRANRLAEREREAMLVAEVVAEAPFSAVWRALCLLDAPSLAILHSTLAQSPTRIS